MRFISLSFKIHILKNWTRDFCFLSATASAKTGSDWQHCMLSSWQSRVLGVGLWILCALILASKFLLTICTLILRHCTMFRLIMVLKRITVVIVMIPDVYYYTDKWVKLTKRLHIYAVVWTYRLTSYWIINVVFVDRLVQIRRWLHDSKMFCMPGLEVL